jgi:hypothetical protein
VAANAGARPIKAKRIVFFNVKSFLLVCRTWISLNR